MYWSEMCVCVCVCSAHSRSFLIVLVLRRTSWPLHKGCLASFTLSSIPTRGLPGDPFPISLPSIANGTRSPCDRVWPSQKSDQIRNEFNLFIITTFEIKKTVSVTCTCRMYPDQLCYSLFCSAFSILVMAPLRYKPLHL